MTITPIKLTIGDVVNGYEVLVAHSRREGFIGVERWRTNRNYVTLRELDDKGNPIENGLVVSIDLKAMAKAVMLKESIDR